MNGTFIVFEGADGAGKTTQVRLLEQGLSPAGYDTVVVRDPDGTPLGEAIRPNEDAVWVPQPPQLLKAAPPGNLTREHRTDSTAPSIILQSQAGPPST